MWAVVLGGKEGGLADPGKSRGKGRQQKAADTVLPDQGRFSLLGREARASRTERCRGEAPWGGPGPANILTKSGT